MGDVVQFRGAGLPPAVAPLPMPPDADVSGFEPSRQRCYGCGHLLGECTCYDAWFALQDQVAEVSRG